MTYAQPGTPQHPGTVETLVVPQSPALGVWPRTNGRELKSSDTPNNRSIMLIGESKPGRDNK